MDIIEYEKIKDLTYLDYCKYLQNKYGKPITNYLTANWNRVTKISRTSEDLYCHHIYEDTAIMLSDKEHAQKHPFEWQQPENLCYCDLLEHLLLHILICEFKRPKTKEDLMLMVSKLEIPGIGGILNFIVPELNDVYRGWESKALWQQNCHSLIKKDKAVYFKLIKRLKQLKNYPCYKEEQIYTSAMGKIDPKTWNNTKNIKLYEELKKIK